MKILAIETSCDETAVSIVEASGEIGNASFSVLGNALLSQVEIHKEYGGVFPMLAKREHAKNLVPILTKALEEAKLLTPEKSDTMIYHSAIKILLEREEGLAESLLKFLEKYKGPPLDAIAVTSGPGLEPALWVGINFAKALALAWDLPVVPINHLEGHIIASLLIATECGAGVDKVQMAKTKASQEHSDILKNIRMFFRLGEVEFPALALLISGGHTELVLMKEWLSYELIGSTLDDAVGEAFDKVARMLSLPYPGGPQISRLAESAREKNARGDIKLPRPMIFANNCDFSFSGLKTAALYALRDIPAITDEVKETFAREFEDAVTEVLISKTKRAMKENGIKTLIIGGGVSANKNIRREFEVMVAKEFLNAKFYIPSRELTTDNAVMIAAAAYFRIQKEGFSKISDFIAEGNLSLAQ